MSRREKFLQYWLMLLSVVLTTGCSPLENWVKERGFHYDKNYSTINKLGYKIVQEMPKPNPSWRFKSKRGIIPDVEDERNRTIKIKSTGELSKILKRVTNADLSAQLKFARHCTIKFQRPFTEEAFVFIPTYTGSESTTNRLKIVDRVLNCGKMEITIYDEHGMNISANFEVQEIGDITSSLDYIEDSNSVVSGKNFYVGYGFSEKILTTGPKHRFKIGSKPICNKELGILARLRAIREKDEAPDTYEALVTLAVNPMGPTTQANATEIQELSNKLAAMEHEWLTSQLMKAKLIPPWEYAEVAGKNMEEVPIFHEVWGPKHYIIEPGSALAIAPSDEVSFLLFFLDVSPIDKEGTGLLEYEVTVDGQRNILE